MTLVSLPTSPPPPAGFTVHCTPRRCRKKTRSNVFASPSHPGTRSVNSKLVTPQTAALDQSTRGSPKAQSSPRSEGQTPSTYPPGRSVKGKPMLPVTGPTDRKTPFDPIRNRFGTDPECAECLGGVCPSVECQVGRFDKLCMAKNCKID